MGGQSSKEENLRQDSLRSSSSASASSWNSYPDQHSGYGQGGYPYTYGSQEPSYQPYYDTRPPPPPQNYGYEPQTSGRVPRHDDKRKLDRKYSRIADNYNSIDEVKDALHADFFV
jgi:E3 ubiquitin-protein ligase RGLG